MAAKAVKELLDAHLTQPWRGKRSCTWVDESTYWGQASTRRNIMAYYDKPSKICNSPACHIEFRFCRARICRNYGVSTVMNLQQLDPCAVIRRNCRLSVIDPQKLDKKLDEEAGKLLLQHNRSSGAPKSNRLIMRRRLEHLLAHALSSPNCSFATDGLNNIPVQQLIDKAPDISKACVTSINPDALLHSIRPASSLRLEINPPEDAPLDRPMSPSIIPTIAARTAAPACSGSRSAICGLIERN